MPLWVTRSAPDNLATARRLRAIGHRALLLPVLETRRVAHGRVTSGGANALVFTSIHAVRHHRHAPDAEDMPVFAVSDGVATAALAAGYRNVTSTAGSDALLGDLLAWLVPQEGRVLECCSVRTSHRLETMLGRHGRAVERCEVYAAPGVDLERLARRAALTQRVGGILVHSSTGASIVRAVIERTGWQGPVWCISAASAARLEGLSDLKLTIASEPTEQALIEAIRRDTLRPRGPSRCAAADIARAAANDNPCER